MYYLKELFVKGRYGIFVGFAYLIEAQRNYLLPHTSLYSKIRQTALQEYKFIEPNVDRKDIVLQNLSEEDLNKLKSATKKKIVELQNLSSNADSTIGYTSGILALGGLNYFFLPTCCAFFVSTYLLCLVADYAKSLSVIRFGVDPLWKCKMKEIGYIYSWVFGALTVGILTKTGINKLKERVTKEIILKHSTPQKKE